MALRLLHFTLLLLATLTLTFPATGKPTTFGTEKLSHFQFYYHNVITATNPTAINIVKAPPIKNLASSSFGSIDMMDDPLTETPEIGSKMLGRAQGLYGMASQEDFGILMVMNLVLMTGRHNGSTLTVLGRNLVTDKVREMPVVGGSGIFRFARGYVEARTYFENQTTHNAVLKFDVNVWHY